LADPIRRVRAARNRSLWRARLIACLLGLVLGVAGLGWVQTTFQGFLSAEHPNPSPFLLRWALFISVAGAMYGHHLVVRHEDRPALVVLPIEPPSAVRFVLGDAVGLLPVVLAMSVSVAALVPTVGESAAFGLIVLVVSAWASTQAGAAGGLLAARVANSKRWAPLLDLVRGANPREQASFIYAPALVVGTVGALAGLAGAQAGELIGWVALTALLAVGIGARSLAGWLSRPDWYEITHVMASIEARYASLEPGEQRQEVFLQWGVRFLPGAWQRDALLTLRHGWRGLRPWVLGIQGIGVLAFAMAWTRDPTALSRVQGVVLFGAVAVGALLVRLQALTPPLLDRWLARSRFAQLMGRTAAGIGWGAGVVLPPAIALGMRQDVGLELLLRGGVVLALSSFLGAALGRVGMVVYLAVSALMALVVMGVWW